jgi:hypothetical protein
VFLVITVGVDIVHDDALLRCVCCIHL